MNKKTRKELTLIGLSLSIILLLIFVNYSRTKSSINNFEESNKIDKIYNSLPQRARALYYVQSDNLNNEVPERMIELDKLTIGCFGTNTIMRMSDYDTNLGGQCCGTLMDIEDYNIQLKELQEFIKQNGNIILIPKDPYDVPVEHAQMLIQFDKDIKLSSIQEEIFNTAVNISHHGGPCCCKCWKWYMMSGLGKKLIVDYNWSAEQLSELWDISSSCGHKEDTNMFKHYGGTK